MRIDIAVGVCAAVLAACAGGSGAGAPSVTATPPTTTAPAAPAPTTTTTTVSECQTRSAWLNEDSGRYVTEVSQARFRAADLSELGSPADREDFYSVLGDYVRHYGRALDLWRRYEADAEALLRDCWDALPVAYINLVRNDLASARAWWHDERAFCQSTRELANTLEVLDPWAVLGVSC